MVATQDSDTSAERASAERAVRAHKRVPIEWIVLPLAIIVVLAVVFGLRTLIG